MRTLIIVCDEKRKEYANYLSQLISVEDDTEEKTVGVKDGSVQAQVWLEKDFKANSAMFSSAQYVVFIGNSKLLKEQRSHMKTEFSDFGMVYRKLGHSAAIYVDEVVSMDKYDQFITYAQNYEKDIKTLVNNKNKKSETQKVAAGIGATVGGKIAANISAALGGKTVAAIVAPVAFTMPIVGVGVCAIPLAKWAKLKTKIEDQMYTCAIMKFYLENLNKFLGLE